MQLTEAGLTRVRCSRPSGQTCPLGCCRWAWRCRGSSRGWCSDDWGGFACLGQLLLLLENIHSKLISIYGWWHCSMVEKSTITCFSHRDIKNIWQIWVRLLLLLLLLWFSGTKKSELAFSGANNYVFFSCQLNLFSYQRNIITPPQCETSKYVQYNCLISRFLAFF